MYTSEVKPIGTKKASTKDGKLIKQGCHGYIKKKTVWKEVF